jgi:phosphatidylglycerol:prolipoprotein diacylglycerol transferase
VTTNVLAAIGPVVHHPFEFNIGPIPLTGFGIAVVMAFVIAQVIGQHEMQRRGYDPDPIADLVLGAVIGGLLGAKLYFVVVLGNWNALLSRAGFVFWGGFIGGAIGVLLVARLKKVPLWRTLEVSAPALAAAYAVGRTGCWAVGDDYGQPWTAPIAVQFPQGIPPTTAGVLQREFNVAFPAGTDPSTVIAVHPTQLYETAMGMVMFFILWRSRHHRHAEGWLFGLWAVLAGIERFLVEFVRVKDDITPLGLTTAQLVALAAIALGVALIFARRTPRPAVSAS